MAQLRKDPVTSRWIIVSAERPKDAADYGTEPVTKSSKVCPFCPGNEAMTPPEITAYGRKSGAKNTSGWQLRIVPNKFPALRIEESTDKYASGVYDKMGGFGAHEVIIENPDHNKEIPDLDIEAVELILRSYRDRCVDLKKDPRFRYILIFKNYGAAAGASMEHPHSQLIALPIVPSRVMGEVKGAAKHFDYTDRCIFCDMLNQERAEKTLTVHEEAHFIGLSPFASRSPFETWVLPKAHESSFDALSDDRLKGLARTLKTVLGKIRTALGDPPYNFMIHTVPIGDRQPESFHWHIEIIPQLTQIAGFELGTGFYLNPTPPETASKTLKNAQFLA
jgi:UDPglucose--hexose-1-phosphate uridylyltransferase